MAYSSQIDLKISETPKTDNTDLLPDMIDIYNALHILAQYTDRLIISQDKTTGKPWETAGFQQFIEGTAYHDLAAGQIATFDAHGRLVRGGPSAVPIDQDYPRIGEYARLLGRPFESYAYTGAKHDPMSLYGIVLDDAKVGEKATIAIGQGMVESSGGLTKGAFIMVYPSVVYQGVRLEIPNIPQRLTRAVDIYNGNIHQYITAPGRGQYQAGGWFIGQAIADNAIWFFPQPIAYPAILRFQKFTMPNGTWPTNSGWSVAVPAPPNTEPPTTGPNPSPW